MEAVFVIWRHEEAKNGYDSSTEEKFESAYLIKAEIKAAKRWEKAGLV